jgi:peptidoglycan/LPS O-acetylase OafA/YrhL
MGGLVLLLHRFHFFSKVIDARTKPIDWSRLYVSRLLRLGPLYAFAMAVMFLLIAVLSHGVIKQPARHLVASMGRWLGFTILGAPNINGFAETPLLVAWVTWSLTYEWFFYISLPLLALAVLTPPPVAVLAASAGSVVFLASRGPDFSLLAPFLGGITAAVLARLPNLQRFSTTGWASWICLASVASAIAVSETAYSPAPLALFSIAFTLVASGNTLFGVLGFRVSRTLGEASYSLYLLHGLILFAMFRFVIGFDAARSLSPMLHWLVVLALTPLLICTCFATYLIIERPAMMSTDRVLGWIRAYWAHWQHVMRQLLTDERRLR